MATIKDIAKEAGVSHGTVSNVLNKTGKVSAEKIRLVEEAARRLGYKINAQAKQLRGGSSKIICLILPNIQLQCYIDLHEQIRHGFSDSEYEVILYTTDRIPSSERKIWDKALAFRPDAVICSTCLDTIPDLDTIDFPIILIDYIKPIEHPFVFCASFDFARAAADISRFIRQKSYRNIALFATSGKSAAKTVFSDTLTELTGSLSRLVPFSSDDKLMLHKSFEIVHSAPGYDLIITFHPEQAQCITQAAMYMDAKEVPDIITLASSRTIPDRRFLSYELNYKLMGKTIAETLLEYFRTKAEKKLRFKLENTGFRRLQPNPGRPAAKTSVNILTLESPASAALDMLLPDFERRTGIHANLTILAFDELYDTICTMGGSSCYDLIRSDVAWLSHLAPKIYLPLRETSLNLDSLLSGLIEETGGRFTTVDDLLYTLPFDPSIQMLFYRSDLFEDAMVKRQYYEMYREELSVPRTYKQYNKVAAFFTRAVNPASAVSYGTTMTFGSSSVAACDFLPRLMAFGGSVFDADGLLAVNTPTFMEAIENYMETYKYTDRSVNMWWKQSVENFSMGDTAMTITFNNHASYLINSKHSHVVDRLGFAMVPGGRPLLGGGVIGISKASKNREAACEFLKWVYSDEISGILTALGGTSANRSVYANGEITTLFPWLETARRSFRQGTRCTKSSLYPMFNQKTFETILGTAVRSAVTEIMSANDALNYAQKVLGETFAPCLTADE